MLDAIIVIAQYARDQAMGSARDQAAKVSLRRVDHYHGEHKPVDRGGSVGSDEPPRLPNGPLEVFRKLLYWLLLTLQIAVARVEDYSKPVIRLAS